MIAILNLLPVLFFFAMVYWAKARYSKSKSAKSFLAPLLAFVITTLFYFQIQPSYMPKGHVSRSSIPPIEQSGELKDIAPKPMPADERDQKRQERYKEPLPFLEEK